MKKDIFLADMILLPSFRIAALKASHKMLEDSYSVYKDKVIRKYSANNWLKMHGYPMRRRAR